MKPEVEPESVLSFWFGECDDSDRFPRDDKTRDWVDGAIRERFGDAHAALSREVPADWLDGPYRRLAAIVVLDQFSRNLNRGSSVAFANDEAALALARETIERGGDDGMPDEERQFLYMPFMHSEDAADQARSVELFAALGDRALDYAKQHKAIIDRFGRFPHRNAALGRATTPEEADFLRQPGSSF